MKRGLYEKRGLVFSEKRRLDSRGVIIIWLGLGMLILLILFAGLGVDIVYMYSVKNQLAVSTDAGSLAGAALLTGIDTAGNLAQESARQEAWKFACKNKAAGSNVYLVTNNPVDCNTPPPGTSLNSSNAANGDIVVGYWTRDNSGVNCSTGWETAGSGFFCRADGTTGLFINAMKAVARRSADGSTYGMGPVSVFWGKVFGWPQLSSVASSIAARLPLKAPAMSLCTSTCALSCTASTPCDLLLQENTPGSPVGIAWTEFGSSQAPNIGSNGGVSKIISGDPTVSIPTNLCNSCITTNNGVGNALQALQDAFSSTTYDKANKDFDNSGNVIRWRVVSVVLDDNPICLHTPGTACPPGQQGHTNELYHVIELAKMEITSVNTSGSTKGITVDQVQCIGCPTSVPPGAGIALVK